MYGMAASVQYRVSLPHRSDVYTRKSWAHGDTVQRPHERFELFQEENDIHKRIGVPCSVPSQGIGRIHFVSLLRLCRISNECFISQRSIDTSGKFEITIRHTPGPH